MAKRKTIDKGWTCQQLRGIAGLGILAFVDLLVTGELPRNWAIPIGIGQTVGLVITGISAFYCFSVSHKGLHYKCGNGTICKKCELPRLSDAYHCDMCCICVPGYSHHSYWLNTCIGTANTLPYLLCLAGMALTAICQVSADLVLMIWMLSEHSFALHLARKYSLLDQGYLFNLFLPFSFLVSSSVVIASCFNLGFHLWKTVFRWRLKRKPAGKRVYPEWLHANSSAPIPLSDTSGLTVAAAQFKGADLTIIDGRNTGETDLKRVSPWNYP